MQRVSCGTMKLRYKPTKTELKNTKAFILFRQPTSSTNLLGISDFTTPVCG